MADQFLQISLVEDPGKFVRFEPHILPIGKSSRGRAAAVYEWTPLDKKNPGSAEGLGIGPLQWRISGPVVLGSYRNPKMLSPEGLRRWALLEEMVGQDVSLLYGDFPYGTWVIKDVNMDGDVLSMIPESEDPGADLWMSFTRQQWRLNLVQKEPPPEGTEYPVLYGGLIPFTDGEGGGSTGSTGAVGGVGGDLDDNP